MGAILLVRSGFNCLEGFDGLLLFRFAGSFLLLIFLYEQVSRCHGVYILNECGFLW